MRELRENNKLIIDWNKFKSNSKGKILEKAKRAYIEFCKMLDEVDFELIGDYIGNKEKAELVYKSDNSIRLNINSSAFKSKTYKTIINLKSNLKENNDEFVKFVGISNGGNLIAKIKTFDGGKVNVDTNAYSKFNNARKDFYNKLKEVGGYVEDYYKGKNIKINIYINDVKLNSISPNHFKRQTYRAIIDFKNNLEENNDEFVEFIGLDRQGKLIAQIKAFDSGVIDIDISNYNSFAKGRQDTYDYCKSKGYKILSPYVKDGEKILIDFNCGHEPNWIIPNSLKKNKSCPVCKESKGEKAIREYLEKNNIIFKQEYKFEDCRYKYVLPFDFYISSKNLCIEFDGRQHFESNDFFGGEKSFKDTKIRDKIKNNYCKDNNIKLIRIPYWELDSIEKILDKEFKRLKEINNELEKVC
ncbi:hypothetical protein QTH25_13120 [Clostridium perfringens]|uniref:hypothetical protein n=1 Tax=Clostridium perfringens TaxID=1502 RepID=UPI00338ED3DA|nr:hypothetical protein [Clostridium perfringens]